MRINYFSTNKRQIFVMDVFFSVFLTCGCVPRVVSLVGIVLLSTRFGIINLFSTPPGCISIWSHFACNKLDMAIRSYRMIPLQSYILLSFVFKFVYAICYETRHNMLQSFMTFATKFVFPADSLM
jgi:hypothetical protein